MIKADAGRKIVSPSFQVIPTDYLRERFSIDMDTL